MLTDFTTAVSTLAAGFSGTIGVCAERLDTGQQLAYNPDGVFYSASVIKLPVLVEFFRQVDTGRLSLDRRVEFRDSDKVIGSGILNELRAGLNPTLEDLLVLMMVISDNTATNILIDQVGIDQVNATLQRLGLTRTRLTGKILVDQTHQSDTPTGRGELSPTTAGEMVALLKQIERRECLQGDACAHLLNILKRVQTESMIKAGLPYHLVRPDEGEPTIVVAHKTGTLYSTGVRNNVGLVYTPHFTYAVALLSQGSKDTRATSDQEGRVVLGKVSKLIYDEFMAAQ